MALTAAFVIDPSTDEEPVTAEGVSDLDDEVSSSASMPVHELFEAQEGLADSGMEGSLFDLRDQVAVTAFGTDDDDEILGGDGSDYLSGRDGDDTLDGGAGADELHGELGDDLLLGQDGGDSLFGHVGDDSLFGGDGADSLIGGDGADQLFGGAGADELSGNLGQDTLYGGAGEDTLFGGAEDDVIDGRDDGASDFLNGGAGDDRLIAGLGDKLHGGDGADTFALEAQSDALVSDFDPLADQIELEYEGDVAPNLSTQSSGDGLVLLADGAPVMTLAGVTSFDVNQVQLIKV